MSSKITLYIARHGKTMMNTLDRVQGWCDSPLTKEGIDVARYLGYGMSDINFRTAYCSDLRRTVQTTKIVLGAKGQEDIPVIELAGLREACFGSFEADFNHHMWNSAALYLHHTSSESMIKAIMEKEISYREVLDAVKKLDKMGMAENFSQVEARTQESLLEIAKNESRYGDGNILVISHGMSILAMLLGLGGDKLFKKPLENAAVCKVIYQDGKFTVESMADMSYVEKGKKEAAAI
ncbi:histidine phosphatase family protein [Dysgonomonas sp. GY75]|uniref:histidine phosphatase family protein n=1 Tax=Dysgonomonas sp. GY75 TaxID=2780419 RepID=UPI00188341B1|nr:histidine phosphatase family protein [Dysgonomonas sp. GY75]MBF0648315.1 histidine phosphatase family protein [Dysgonomonas sp. GY75]